MPPQAKTATVPPLAEARMRTYRSNGLTPEYISAYAVPADPSRRIQIRDEHSFLDSKTVTRRKEAIERREELPPTVFTRDGFVVDGNHNTAAYRALKQLTMPAIVLDVDFIGNENTDTGRLLRMLGGGANFRNGRGMTPDEEEALILDGLRMNRDYTSTRIAEMLGLPATSVQAVQAQQRTKDRADQLGVDLNGSMTKSHLRTLGQLSDGLNDAPYRALLQYVADAGLQTGEIRPLVKAMKATGSDEGMLDLLERERFANNDRIRQYARTRKARPSPAAKLRQQLGGLREYAQAITRAETELVEYGTARAEHLEIVETAVRVLSVVRDRQRSITQEG